MAKRKTATAAKPAKKKPAKKPVAQAKGTTAVLKSKIAVLAKAKKGAAAQKVAAKKVRAVSLTKPGAYIPPRPAKPATRFKDDGGAVLTKSPFNKEELEYFRQLLLTRKRMVLGNVDSLGEDAMTSQQAAGDLSSMPIHLADMGSDTFEQDMNLRFMEMGRDILQDLDEALGRIDDGVYGICEVSGKAIPKKRLEFLPYARTRVEYAEEFERRGAEDEPQFEEEEEES